MILSENVAKGDWHGTGYIVMNPETGAGVLGFVNYTYIKSIDLMCAYIDGDEEAGQQYYHLFLDKNSGTPSLHWLE